MNVSIWKLTLSQGATGPRVDTVHGTMVTAGGGGGEFGMAVMNELPTGDTGLSWYCQ